MANFEHNGIVYDSAAVDETLDEVVTKVTPALISPDAPRTSFTDTVNAAYEESVFGLAVRRGSNYIADAILQSGNDATAVVKNQDFNKWDWFNTRGYSHDSISNFASFVDNEDDAIKFDQYYQQSTANQQKIANAGFTGKAAAFVTDLALDPTTYFGFGAGAAVKAGTTAGKIAGLSASGLAAGAASMAARGSLDVTQTTEQAVIGAAAAGGLGALGGLLFSDVTRAALGNANATLDKVARKFKGVSGEEYLKSLDSSVGAMQYKQDKFTVSKPVNPVVEYLVEKGNVVMGAKARGQSRELGFHREISSKMFGQEFISQEQVAGFAAPVDVVSVTNIKQAQTQLAINDLENIKKSAYKKYAQNGSGLSEDQFNSRAYAYASDKNLSLEQLKAMSKQDPANAEIYDTAIKAREHFIVRKEEARDIDDFTPREDVYVPSVLSPEKALADRTKLKAVLIEKKFKVERDAAIVEANRQLPKLEKQLNELKAIRDDATRTSVERQDASRKLVALNDKIDYFREAKENADIDLDGVAESYLNQVTTGALNNNSGRISGVPRYFKARFLEPEDFMPWLEHDSTKLVAMYDRQITPRIAMQEVFGEANIEALLAKTDLDFDLEVSGIADKLNAGEKLKNVKADLKKLSEQHKAFKADLKDGYEMLTGQKWSSFYEQNQWAAQGLPWLRFYNRFAYQGGQALTNLSEIGSIVNTFGVMKTVPKMMSSIKKIALSKDFSDSVRRQGNLTDRTLQMIKMMNIADVRLTSATASEADVKGVMAYEKANRAFNVGTGFAHVMDKLRMVTSATHDLVLDDMLMRHADGLKVSKNEYTQMAELGIGKQNIDYIVGELQKYRTLEDGHPNFNLDQWEDKAAAGVVKVALRRALVRAANDIDVGKIPTILTAPVVKDLFQLKSWAVAATQNYLLRGLQRPVAEQMGVLTFMAGTNALVYAAKETAAGRGEALAELDPEEWLFAGIQQSGYVGLLPEIPMTAAARAAGINAGSAQYPFDFERQLLGVNYSNIERLTAIKNGVLPDMKDGELIAPTEAEEDYAIKSLIKAITPYNYPFLRPLVLEPLEETLKK